MWADANAEMSCDGFADMGEAVGDAEGAAAKRRAEHQDRHALARVVGAAPGRIAAMVGGQDHHVARFQPAVEIGQACVEGFERGGIAGHVAAMAVKHVEIHEIGEDERPVFGLSMASRLASNSAMLPLALVSLVTP